MVDADKGKGLYQKYEIKRTDGSSEPGKKHADCYYYVLDVVHDKFAVPALEAYADACAKEYPELARDLRKLAADLREGRFCARCKGEKVVEWRHWHAADDTEIVESPCPKCSRAELKKKAKASCKDCGGEGMVGEAVCPCAVVFTGRKSGKRDMGLRH